VAAAARAVDSSFQEVIAVHFRSIRSALAVASVLVSSSFSAKAQSKSATLSQILRWADRNAPELAVARAGLSRGRAELSGSSPIFPSDPVLGGSVGRRSTAAGTGVDWEVTLEQELEIFGERAARRSAARATIELGRAGVEHVRWRIHREIHDAFHDALVARARVRTAERFVQFAERFLQVAERRFAAGETSPLPLRLAESELAEAQQAKIAAAQGERSSVLALKLAAGWPVERTLVPAGDLGKPEDAPPLTRLVALARTRDPVLLERAAAVRRARAELTAQSREPWPNPRLGVAYTRESEPGGSAATIWRGTVSVPIPLWQANGRERARARAELDVAIAEHGARRRTIEARVRRAAGAVNASASRVRLYSTKILPGFEQSLALVEKAFELGEIEATEVLVARERFLRSQRTALDAYEEYFRARGALEEAVGTELEDEHERARP
jgi:cobalt-zinc-cadmium efflux system outer membrane protein